MTYYSDRHYERVNGFKPNYLKDEVNMERSKRDHKEINIWAMIALFAGILIIGWLTMSAYHVTHRTICRDIYVQGETGVYCQ